MDHKGYGRCRKRDFKFREDWRKLVLVKWWTGAKKYDPFTCYVDENTYCSDLQKSSTTNLAGKKKSALACQGKCQN